MVQTEQQYKFVYMGIKDYVDSQQALIQASAAVSQASALMLCCAVLYLRMVVFTYGYCCL